MNPTDSVDSSGAGRAYDWQHAAFALGTGALVLSLGAGLLQAFGEGRGLPALSLDPYTRGETLLARGDVKTAIRELRMAARFMSSVDAHTRLGAALLRAGRPSEASSSYARALELDPRSAKALMGLGDARLAEGRAADAAAAYGRALEAEPRNTGLRNNLGIALALAGRAHEAAKEFEAALALGPDPTVSANLARARAQIQQVDLAPGSSGEPR